MKTAEDAIAWVRAQGIALEAAKVGDVPSLAHELVQGPIKGSWWSHPKGKQIFALASAVHDCGEVIALKLIEGKTTYVHETFWPFLLRVLLDAGWRVPRIAKLPPAAKRLYQEVEREREVQGAEAKATRALDASLLVYTASHHTAKGHHEKVLTSWAHWSKTAGISPSTVPLDEAIAKLRLASRGVEVL